MAGGKYAALGKRLADSGLERVRLTFEEMDALCALPKTAYRDRPFWANTWVSARAHAWLGAGYVVDHVSLGRYVEFVRDPVRAKAPGAGRKDRASAPPAPKERKGARTPAEKAETHPYLPLTAENVEKVHRLAMESPQYGGSFALLRDTLRRFPENTDRELVAMKIAMIDVVNSTNLGRYLRYITLEELADIILGIRDFDARLAQGDPDLVGQIARSNGKINLFSFASKYCTYHNADIYGRDDYSIFDRVVKEALPHYVPGLREAAVEKWRTTYDYAAFRGCIDELLDRSGITIPARRRKFDHFLWYANRKQGLAVGQGPED